MALIDELKEQLKKAVEFVDTETAFVRAHQRNVDDWLRRIDDLDRAIAALEPPAVVAGDLKPGEISPGWASYLEAQQALEPAPVAEPALPSMDDIIDPDFTGGLQTEVYLERLHAGTSRSPDPGEPVEHISILTGDPAIEPESGLHGEPVPQPEWNEGYAPVTNPDADAQAKALDYYSPEKIAERNRFNPFAVFRREPEGV